VDSDPFHSTPIDLISFLSASFNFHLFDLEARRILLMLIYANVYLIVVDS